jgi:hypothetical protein
MTQCEGTSIAFQLGRMLPLFSGSIALCIDHEEKFNQTARIQLKAPQPQAYNFGLLVETETAVRLIAIP